MDQGLQFEWHIVKSKHDQGVGSRATIGIVVLANDRAFEADFRNYLEPVNGVGVFATRLPMAAKVSRDSLNEMREHLKEACKLLVPAAHLDTIAFACTSGTVAIGVDVVTQEIKAARPASEVSTPITAGVHALAAVKAKRISLLVPYPLDVANLISAYFASIGLVIDRCTTYDLSEESEMNSVSTDSLVEAGQNAMDPASDALFISCTGLRTCGAIARLEDKLGKPVISSNQALAWDCLRRSGITDTVPGRGLLFAN